MSKDNKLLAFWEKSDKAKRDLDHAKERFREKTYYETWVWAKEASSLLAYSLPLISVVSGFTALSNSAQAIIPFAYIAIAISVALLIALELGKGKIIQTTTDLFYQSPRKAIFGALFSTLLAFASGFASITGAEQLHRQYGDPKTQIEALHIAQTDSVMSHYSNLISTEETALNEFKQSVSWRGRIDMSNKGTVATLKRHNKTIELLQDQKHSALEKLKEERRGDLLSAGDAFKQNKVMILAIIIAIELCILFVNFYPIHFEYCIKKQAQIIEDNLGQQVVSVDPHTLSNVLRMYSPSLSDPRTFQLPANSSNAQSIGFKRNSNESPQSTDKQGLNAGLNAGLNYANIDTDKRKYLERYPNVVNCIQKGLNEKQTLEITDIGRSTYYNVKRIINNL